MINKEELKKFIEDLRSGKTIANYGNHAWLNDTPFNFDIYTNKVSDFKKHLNDLADCLESYFVKDTDYKSDLSESLKHCDIISNPASNRYPYAFNGSLKGCMLIGKSEEDVRNTLNWLSEVVKPTEVNGQTSDGYHTFDELYDHRAKLFSVIVAAFPERSWKSKKHSDGTMYDGMFIVGIMTPYGQATYHYDIDPYWDLFKCNEVEFSPAWDGHTPEQAINRILSLASIIDVEKTATLVYKNFKLAEVSYQCSNCGNLVSRHYLYCPYCRSRLM